MSSNNINNFLIKLNNELINCTSCPLCNLPTTKTNTTTSCSCFFACINSFSINNPINFACSYEYHTYINGKHKAYNVYSLYDYENIDISNLKDLSLNGLISYVSKLITFS